MYFLGLFLYKMLCTCHKTMRLFVHYNIFEFSKNINEWQTTFFFVEQGTSECSEWYQIDPKWSCGSPDWIRIHFVPFCTFRGSKFLRFPISQTRNWLCRRYTDLKTAGLYLFFSFILRWYAVFAAPQLCKQCSTFPCSDLSLLTIGTS